MSDLHLFEGFGIELEYMLVDAETLDVSPRADDILAALNGGQISSDFEQGPITWSNELALHVLELKTSQPAKRLGRVATQFERAIADLRPTLETYGLGLLPTAMHPWMDPTTQTKLWPHAYHEIYATYDRIFDCRSHGWSNVQSVHLNLPFHGDDEFARLHAALRLLLPILPALTASSPIVDGRRTGRLDNRLHFYAHHCDAIPSMTGSIIPEALYDQAGYEASIFEPIKRDILAHDPQQVMNHEFLNARGAIARFDRGSIEIRVMDVQEYPVADIAICGAVIAVARMLVEETWSSTKMQQEMPTDMLRSLFDRVVINGGKTIIEDKMFLEQFGIAKSQLRVSSLWQTLISQAIARDSALAALAAPLEIILKHGTLAKRILDAVGETCSHDDLRNVYAEIANCLYRGEAFYAA